MKLDDFRDLTLLRYVSDTALSEGPPTTVNDMYTILKRLPMVYVHVLTAQKMALLDECEKYPLAEKWVERFTIKMLAITFQPNLHPAKFGALKVMDLLVQKRIPIATTFRLHPELNAMPNRLFYDNTLINRATATNRSLTVFVAYAPTSDYDDEDVEAFYVELEKFYKEDHTFYKVIVGDFNAKIGPRRSPEELHIGTHGLEWNEQGERLSEFIMSTKTIHGNSQFQKPPSLRWTWESPGGQFHNEIDHIIFNRKYCLTDVSVVPKFYTGSDHRLLRARFRFSRQGEKAAKFKKRSPRTTINWDLYTSLVGLWEDAVMDNVDEEYDRFVHHLRDSAKGAESLKTTKRRLSPETLELIRQRGAARASGNYQLTSELAKLCRAAIKEDLKERRAEVLAEAAEAGLSIRNARRNFANFKTKMTALRRPDGTITSSRRTMEKVIHDFYSDLFDSHDERLSPLASARPTPSRGFFSQLERDSICIHGISCRAQAE
ncbi:unnamed protein product [Heligmosomoides polygyrus]|uniref:Reverse transcriptase domain-containing protein n=1 Tax=Heligmosomoides polygyrus TaxID=6339 RepID=A0A183F4L0_HELPZ|nr:unnamed protein product [Heligmosomoides polygyrus]